MDAYTLPADLLKAISHPTRLAVLDILRDGEQCVCHMEASLGLRQSSISQQLMVLREAGLVEVRRDGLNMYYRVLNPRIFPVLDAVYAAAGRSSRPRPSHKHGKGKDACTCPKCALGAKPKLTTLSIPH